MSGAMICYVFSSSLFSTLNNLSITSDRRERSSEKLRPQSKISISNKSCVADYLSEGYRGVQLYFNSLYFEVAISTIPMIRIMV
ncbi:hypothetical protein ACFLS9_03715 [Bacteroidota bacterium]